ncbi:hypothetical protein C8046_00960 [Serinibacter arcticus]|uniref:DUF1345 domain-containing protein n=1 Tax=Serinibacter arcticus TaxID=1655435 RepID=A0A2U1ZRF8_9MICO|nr:DUF1345 domain-containing protein [Serinibacter arcticus]PWD49502.1 hypothetical protein C8046_00960 [Serinibacter arcticus]
MSVLSRAVASDLSRTITATVSALPFALAVTVVQTRVWGAELFVERYAEVGIPTIMLTFWSAATLLYCLLTHVHLSRLGAATLRERSAREAASRHRHWYTPLLGSGGPASWTISGGFIVLVFTLVLAQSPVWRSSIWLLAISALSVASSWVVMVYTHALRYCERDAQERSLDFGGDEEPVFADYLQHSLLVSVAGVAAPATPTTRAGWRDLTQHAVTAFIVNGVLVAMIVTLLLGRFT